MRLLRFRDSDTLELTQNLHDDDIPLYAILSHTWGADCDEVTFTDLQSQQDVAWTSKAGYDKIAFCAAQARKDGIEHFWVDTCCINKEDNAELSESITSMYRWYGNAVKCYVYLSDLSINTQNDHESSGDDGSRGGDESTGDDRPRIGWELRFRQCRWFTRGWTLQELLAPEEVEFYSQERAFLGTKATLAEQISAITTIPLAALCAGPSLSQFPVSERLRWAQHRETKKQEDKAYCLLGIFGVYMVQNYGERDNAFHRLLEAIRSKESGCLQVFKTSAYEDFKDRNPLPVEGTCQWVLTHPQFLEWRESTHNDLLWISADPGCGKSVLARSLAERDLLHGNPRPLVCYFFFKDNEEQDNLPTALCAILHQLFTQPQEPDLIRHALPSCDRNGPKIQNETMELWRILQLLAEDDTVPPILCVLDALDECREIDRQRLVSLLCDCLRPGDGNDQNTSIKFLVTSRPYDSVERWFERALSQRLHTIRLRGEDENEQIQREINLVIERHLLELGEEFHLSAATQDRLRTTLVQMHHRTYLWLDLAMDSIRETYQNSLDPNAVVIHSLPRTVEEAYEGLLRRINEQQQPRARQILLIIVGARRPLTIGELAWALSSSQAHGSLQEQRLAGTDSMDSASLPAADVQHVERQIRHWCGLFVFVQNSSLHLFHQTAKEFLLSETSASPSPMLWQGCLKASQIELEMAKICTTFLCLTHGTMRPSNGVLSLTRPQVEFSRYCSEYWLGHLQHDDQGSDSLLFDYAVELCDVESDLFAFWFAHFWKVAMPHLERPTMLVQHVLAVTGNRVMLHHLHRKERLDFEARDATGRTPLHWAAERGNLDAAKWLLDEGADLESQGGEHGTALLAALESGDQDIVKLLLDAGAETNASGGYYGNALRSASVRGDVRVVTMLLGAGADVNDTGGRLGNALIAASEGGHDEVVRVLLHAGADVNALAGYENSAHYAASLRGYDNIAQMLLNARLGNILTSPISAQDQSGTRGMSPRDTVNMHNHPNGVVGLQNLGNTGWMNAVLQCMRNVHELTQYLQHDHWKEEVSTRVIQDDSGQCVRAYVGLMHGIASSVESYSPASFRRMVGSQMFIYKGHRPQDAFEFLSALLHRLSEELHRVAGSTNSEDILDDIIGWGDFSKDDAVRGWRQTWLGLRRTGNDSIITDLFTVMLGVKTICLDCEEAVFRFDHSYDLTLDLPKRHNEEHPVSLAGCLTEFCGGTDPPSRSWNCSYCNSGGEMQQRFELWSAPDVLVIRLKRFRYSEDLEAMEKVETMVHCPVEGLDISDVVNGEIEGKSLVYDLLAVINFHGVSHGGYVTATTKHNGSQNWYEYKDSHVTLVENRDQVVTKNAYVLFYQRRAD